MKKFLFFSLLGFVSSFPSQSQNKVQGCGSNCRGVSADECPPSDCPSVTAPPINRVCGSPDCTKSTNRPFLFPHNDPTKYYQCVPSTSIYGWSVMERVCGCETYFNYDSQNCVHPFEWVVQCSGTSSNTPAPIPCPRQCTTCDIDSDETTISVSTTTELTTTTLSTTEPTTLAPTEPATTISSTLTTTEPTTITSTTTTEATTTTSLLSTISTSTSFCNCFCWCPCPNNNLCWFPCVCNMNNCSC